MSEKNQPISGNDLARFSGPNSFMRLPMANSLQGLDVAVLGVPMDIGTSWRSGTRFGIHYSLIFGAQNSREKS